MVENKIVELVVAGSNPVGHPIPTFLPRWNCLRMSRIRRAKALYSKSEKLQNSSPKLQTVMSWAGFDQEMKKPGLNRSAPGFKKRLPPRLAGKNSQFLPLTAETRT